MKKSKMVLSALCLAALGFLLAGCATTGEEKKPETESVVAPTDLANCENFEDAGKKMITSVLTGLSTGNYALYSRDFSEGNKKYFDKETFKKAYDGTKENLGDFKGEEFLGYWKKGDYDIMLWKTQFSKTEDDILVELYVKKFDGVYQIAAVKLL